MAIVGGERIKHGWPTSYMLHEVMYGYKPGACETSEDKVIVLDELNLHHGKAQRSNRAGNELTDESMSAYSEMDENYPMEVQEHSPKSVTRQLPRFVLFQRIIVEVEDSRSVQSAEKSMEMFKPKLLILSNAPTPPGADGEQIVPFESKNDIADIISQKLNSGEKKVPLAPKNQSKRNFNFDKGFLADRTEKLTKAAPVENPQHHLLEDQLSLRIGSIKTRNKQTKLNLENVSEIKHNSKLSFKIGQDESPERQAIKEDTFHEKLNQKDREIEGMRQEIAELNSKNKNLLSEVCDLRQSLANLESQFNTFTRSTKELRGSEGNLLLRHKVHSRVNKEKTADGRIMLTKESGFASSEINGSKHISIKDKCKDLGTLVSKFSGSKKIAKSPLGAVSGSKIQKTVIMTPKGVSRVSFHPKSSR